MFKTLARAEKNETSLSHKCTEAQRVEVRDRHDTYLTELGLEARASCWCLSLLSGLYAVHPEWEQAVLAAG